MEVFRMKVVRPENQEEESGTILDNVPLQKTTKTRSGIITKSLLVSVIFICIPGIAYLAEQNKTLKHSIESANQTVGALNQEVEILKQEIQTQGKQMAWLNINKRLQESVRTKNLHIDEVIPFRDGNHLALLINVRSNTEDSSDKNLGNEIKELMQLTKREYEMNDSPVLPKWDELKITIGVYFLTESMGEKYIFTYPGTFSAESKLFKGEY